MTKFGEKHENKIDQSKLGKSHEPFANENKDTLQPL